MEGLFEFKIDENNSLGSILERIKTDPKVKLFIIHDENGKRLKYDFGKDKFIRVIFDDGKPQENEFAPNELPEVELNESEELKDEESHEELPAEEVKEVEEIHEDPIPEEVPEVNNIELNKAEEINELPEVDSFIPAPENEDAPTESNSNKESPTNNFVVVGDIPAQEPPKTEWASTIPPTDDDNDEEYECELEDDYSVEFLVNKLIELGYEVTLSKHYK